VAPRVRGLGVVRVEREPIRLERPHPPWGRYWLTADLPGYPADGETDDDVTKLKASADRLFAELLAALGLAERGTRTES